MIKCNVGKYIINVEQYKLPEMYSKYVENAKLNEEYELNNVDGELFFMSASIGDNWPFLTVTQRYEPNTGGFHPGFLLIPETDTLFIGAGQTILAYNLKDIKKIDEDYYYGGFLGWLRYKDYVVMMAEVDIACWKNNGEKLWTRFAEPPYNIEFNGDEIILDSMGEIIKFNLE